MVNLSVESSVHATVSDGESPNVHCRGIRDGFQAKSRSPGGRAGAVRQYAEDGEYEAGGENGGGVGGGTFVAIPPQSQPRSGRKEPSVGGDGDNQRRRNQVHSTRKHVQLLSFIREVFSVRR